MGEGKSRQIKMNDRGKNYKFKIAEAAYIKDSENYKKSNHLWFDPRGVSEAFCCNCSPTEGPEHQVFFVEVVANSSMACWK